ncbi:MAG TPA: ATP-binding cassette domain-containing protein [Bellilinea sp.]|nr:ATP-binding cassette domain-containing protein [Bellilinea sp.]
MPTIQVENIVKTFGKQRAVDGVTFEVEPGEIFGLLGPNGAGKTTIIRIILDIFQPDAGKVAVFGGPMSEAKKDRIGFLPEERGLYQDISVDQCLVYLAQLKGLDKSVAQQRLEPMLQRFDLIPHRKKKVKELSKGMQQKCQLITALIHDPELIIIDEPFSALDPVNTQMVKDILVEERNRGKCVVMCTHQMPQVEELADRLILINKGKILLYGTLKQIRDQYKGSNVLVAPQGPLPAGINGIGLIEEQRDGLLVHLQEGTTPQMLLTSLVQSGVNLDKFEIAVPTLDEIFIEAVKGEAPVE